MGLSAATLKDEFAKLTDPDNPDFVGHPTTIADAASNWGNAYAVYAASAEDISTDSILTTNLTGFINALIANLPTGETGTIALAANAFELAFVAFWTAATFNVGLLPPNGIGGTGTFSAETTSVVSSITADILKNLLEVEFAVLSSDRIPIKFAMRSFSRLTSSAVFFMSNLNTILAAIPVPDTPIKASFSVVFFHISLR